MKTWQKIYFYTGNNFGNIANLKLHIYGVMKMYMEFYYGGGAGGPPVAPKLI